MEKKRITVECRGIRRREWVYCGIMLKRVSSAVSTFKKTSKCLTARTYLWPRQKMEIGHQLDIIQSGVRSLNTLKFTKVGL